MWRRATLAVLISTRLGAVAVAAPVALTDAQGLRYRINADVPPGVASSSASGSVSDATYTRTVIATFTTFTYFSTYTFQVASTVHFGDAFRGFNGLLVNGALFNQNGPLAGRECEQGGTDRQLVFPVQRVGAFEVTRKVFVPANDEFLRWLNVVTNTAAAPGTVDLVMPGALGSGAHTRVGTSSSGGAAVGPDDTWYTTYAFAPGGGSLQPRLGYVIQGPGAPVRPASVAVGPAGRTRWSYAFGVAPGQTAIVMTFVTGQPSRYRAARKASRLAALPAKAVECLTPVELGEIVNFNAPPFFVQKARVRVNFERAGADRLAIAGRVNVGAGLTLPGMVVTADLGGVTRTFVLDRRGVGRVGRDRLVLHARRRHGVTTLQQARFDLAVRRGSFSAALAGFGLTGSRTVKDVPVAVPFTLRADGLGGTILESFGWTATAGRFGTARGR